jgi:hypothetical protein
MQGPDARSTTGCRDGSATTNAENAKEDAKDAVFLRSMAAKHGAGRQRRAARYILDRTL